MAENGLFSSIRNAYAEYKSDKAEKAMQRAELEDEYRIDRDSIILGIQNYIKEKNYEEAKLLIDKFSAVAAGDAAFIELKKYVNEQINKNNKLEGKLAILEALPDNNWESKFEIYQDLVILEPENPSWLVEKKKCEQALGLVPIIPDDLRLGRIVKKYKCNPELTLRLHTHGISFVQNSVITRFHYTQIIKLESSTKSTVSSFMKSATGAAIGFLLLGGIGALAGAAFANNDSDDSDHILNILYWDITSGARNVIQCSWNSSERIKLFITDYNREIHITKQTNRPPKSETNIALVVPCLCAGIILLLAIIAACIFRTSDSAQLQQNNQIDNRDNQIQHVPLTEKLPPSEEHAQWVASQNSCSIQYSSTTLSVLENNSSGTKIEITGILAKSCNEIHITFDNQPFKTPKCSISGDRVTLASNERFIKKMRQSANMTVTFPAEDSTTKTLDYTLMGFSKICAAVSKKENNK